jgi:hypothetical protein
MKKILCSVSLVLLFLQGYSYPIIKRNTSGGVFNHYNKTYCGLQQFDAGDGKTYWGWVVDCADLGFTSCPNRSSLASPCTGGKPDATDISTVGDLLDYADGVISNGSAGDNGTHTTRVQVSGENFERVYTLTWIINSDGSTLSTIDRTDV